ncbi:NADH:flavin oxidoreductase/NADH oxidase [Paraburkholderia sabiae]|uniref:NADH:flavin oxidoreductase/NADH oxidase n=1 Tax=Paraburkholderia sabiae TaxID=273251 RepID=A0ABU9QKA6_9BURK|nr:NADH:flavin oxidoreductase/NADH oxidase [Paraburkholderia sabiae]WJZ76473.1 NADH:flavin oxidoreductase/NADH oxidase [Paraburkholderia sabiae]CAD6560160.1 NADPH dehydrogenase [Paraburkholderia sabiae]
MSSIFTPLTLRSVTIKNRIAMAPMLMYTGQDDGRVTDLHLAHYGARALGGVGLITTEVVAVDRAGRISKKDLGLWDDNQIEGLTRLSGLIRACGAASALQLAHAGRKSTAGERIFAPSAIAHSDDALQPVALTLDEIKGLVNAYGNAASRAAQTGFDCLEIHAAHGYLIHEFLSPLSNLRNDEYGGSRENRWRFLLEIVEAVRKAWPEDKPLIVRLSAEDKAGEGGATIVDTIGLGERLKSLGVDALSVSAGGLTPTFDGEIYPGYQVGYAEQIRRALNIPVGCNGSITSSELIESILHREASDLVYMGRELLRNPFWLLNVAKSAGANPELAIPAYARATGPYERGH